ncbi:DNA mismatch repair endonuclease MutL [Pseudomonadota bacterium]|nr:DNA mismatch repair endonuclease MutL [Pseudomonadota bacterium]
MSSSNRISHLPIHLANQIAAGEVIERPASVVKELVENSLDAGATEITIDIEGAGSKLIRVRDNGFGIHPDDLPLALSRHATSKLQSSEQLSHIASLGFRGEALPSITSISQLTITSLRQEQSTAWLIKGDENIVAPASHPQGTTIEVRDLFFNLPARRHFLRSNKTEQHHILTTLQRLALSQFDVGFHCKLSDSQQLKLPIAKTEAQKKQRLAKICGKNFVENCVFLQQNYNDIGLTGWLAKAEAHRPQTDVQHFFINGRVIRDRMINHAIRQAYGDLIPAGRQPAYVLYLTIPLDRVDINVHPTKHEVRFREARLVHGLITTALEEALSLSFDQEESADKARQPYNTPRHLVADTKAEYHNAHLTPPTKSNTASNSLFKNVESLLHQRYALCHSSQGPVVIDLITAEQQLRQQQLHHAIITKTLSSRPILVPLKLPLPAQLISVVEKHTETLAEFGIELQPQNDNVLIKQIPSLLAQSDLKQLIRAVAEQLTTADTDLEPLLIQHLVCITIVSLEQANTLITQLNDGNIDSKWCVKLDQQSLDGLFSKEDPLLVD